MDRRYVSDIIGDDYKNWKTHDRILISTGTGSGKSTFVLQTLLRHAKAQNKHVVYFCNRRILNHQLQSIVEQMLSNELGDDTEDLRPYLHIRTYQHTECVRDFPNIKALNNSGNIIKLSDTLNPYLYEVRSSAVLYYIFDEAHYFIADAAFQSGTYYWYTQLDAIYNSPAIMIFLTATPASLYPYLYLRHCSLSECCMEFIARYFVNKDISRERWISFLSASYKNYKFSQLDKPEFKASIFKEEIDCCKEPYTVLYQIIEASYKNTDRMFTYHYTDTLPITDQYSYLSEFYFDELTSISEQISESVGDGEKWLIFVRKKKDAETLKAILATKGCDAFIVTSQVAQKYDGKPRQRKSHIKDNLDALILHQQQKCPVVISTSVLDNGITLHACDVKNIVICQPQKVEFLQMLGRIRVKADETVNLYIQRVTPNEIKGFVTQYRKELLFLVGFWLKDEKVVSSRFCYEDADKIVSFKNNTLYVKTVNFLTEHHNDLLKRVLANPTKLNYMLINPDKKDKHSSNNIDNLQVNVLGILYYLGELYQMNLMMRNCNKKDPYYYLKAQLSWIGKEYDPARWVDYNKHLNDLYEYLDSLSTSEILLSKEDQTLFQKNCLTYLLNLRELPKQFESQKNRYSLSSKKFPGKKTLNTAFEEAGFPFMIEAVQPKKPIYSVYGQKISIDQKTYWRIVKTIPEK